MVIPIPRGVLIVVLYLYKDLSAVKDPNKKDKSYQRHTTEVNISIQILQIWKRKYKFEVQVELEDE